MTDNDKGMAGVAKRSPSNNPAHTKPGAAFQNEPYRVGFGRPPQHTQFKKGQSGNPRGRPKGRKNLRSMVVNFLAEEVTLTNANGRKVKVPTLEVMLRAARAKVVKGDTRAFDQMIRLMDRFGMFDPPPNREEILEYALSTTTDEELQFIIEMKTQAKAATIARKQAELEAQALAAEGAEGQAKAEVQAGVPRPPR